MPVPRESAWKNARATSARRGKRPFAAECGVATNLYDCLHPTEACVADGPTVACTQGYGGVLCGNCTDGYTRNGRRCVPCPATERSAGMVVAGAIVVYGVLLYNALHADGQESVASALWRIFISYYGLCAAAGEFRSKGTALFVAFTSALPARSALTALGRPSATAA